MICSVLVSHVNTLSCTEYALNMHALIIWQSSLGYVLAQEYLHYWMPCSSMRLVSATSIILSRPTNLDKLKDPEYFQKLEQGHKEYELDFDKATSKCIG